MFPKSILSLCIFMLSFSTGWGSISYNSESSSFTINSGSLALNFTQTKKQIQLSSLEEIDGIKWISQQDDSMWAITVRNDKEKDKKVSQLESSFESWNWEEEGAITKLALHWAIPLSKDVKGKFTLFVQPIPEENGLLINFSTQLPTAYQLQSFELPLMNQISLQPEMKMIAPKSWGVEFDMKPGFIYDDPYPSWSSFQFMAFRQKDSILYMAAEDREAWTKELKVNVDEKHISARFITTPFLTECSKQEFILPFSFRIKFLKGSYEEVAKEYRKFALTTPWYKGARKNIENVLAGKTKTKWFYETDLCLTTHHTTDEGMSDIINSPQYLDDALQAIEYFETPILFHWYNWHKIPFDRYYPDYFPARDNLKEKMKIMQKAGCHLMPYLNIRLCDPDSRFWKEHDAADATLIMANGERLDEMTLCHTPSYVMCPTSEKWSKEMERLAKKLLDEYPIDAIYLDQMACARGFGCYAKNHKHPLGGGTNWQQGYENIAKNIRSHLSEEQVMTTEENGECWMHTVEGHLMVNGPTKGKMVPIFPLIYSDATVPISVQYFYKNPPLLQVPFRVKNSYAFLWGSIPGWIEPWRLFVKGGEEQVAFLKMIAHTRKYARPYLTGGRFLGMYPLEGDIPHVNFRAPMKRGAATLYNQPSVMAALWQSSDNKIAVIMVNHTDEDCKISCPIPEPAKDCKKIKIWGAEGLIGKIKIEDKNIDMNIPARNARVIGFEKGSRRFW